MKNREDFPNGRIEDEAQLLRWANEVNRPMSIQEKCDYQDLWGHSNRKTLDDLFIDMKTDRSLVVHGVLVTMAYQEVEHLVATLYRHKANKLIEEEIDARTAGVEKREREASLRESRFEEGKRAMYRKIRELERWGRLAIDRRDTLERERAEYVQQARDLRREVGRLKIKAEKYDAIKAALAD